MLPRLDPLGLYFVEAHKVVDRLTYDLVDDF